MDADTCAKELLDVVPSVMRFIRGEMRSHRAPGLSIPQFRALVYIHRNADVSLTAVAEHLGLTPPTTSSLVDGLARRSLLLRTASREDRRKVILALTPSGKKAMEAALQETQRSLAALVEGLTPGELATVADAMAALRRTFIAARSAVA
jgi:DNA-binding MarR family transcriptional regulator